MRIGFLPVLSTMGGGNHHYSLSMLRALYARQGHENDDEFIVFISETCDPAVVSGDRRGWTVETLYPPSLSCQVVNALQRLLGEGLTRGAWVWLQRRLQGEVPDPDMIRFRPKTSRWFHRCGVEFMLYPAPNSLSFETAVPYVMAIHDLQHRLQPEFPEVSANGEWEWREYLFRNGARHATLLLADSEVGKEDILSFYGQHGVTSDRVKILPFRPACHLDADVSESERLRVRSTYDLPERYLFYPAQFWPHKNHARIVQALWVLKEEHRVKIPVVFCGSYTGEIRERTFHEIISLSHQLRLDEQIRYLGYVPDKDMSGLYAEAVALVMPTFFGPTNIPILEAWALSCSVLTSDIRGIREQVRNAAILVDPRSVESIADGIYRLWTDENLRRSLAERGLHRLSRYTSADYGQRLIEILEEAKVRVRSEQPRSPKR